MAEETDIAAGLLPPAAAVAVADPRSPATGLLGEEVKAIANAVHKRAREFAAGRRAARSAMAQLGLPAQQIPMGKRREPVWPAGLVGSISHTDKICIAAVGPADRLGQIGIDIETDAPLDADLWDTILTPAERIWLNVQPASQRGRLVRLIFSAKESVYKAQFPISGKFLDFPDVEIATDASSGEFRATFREGLVPEIPSTVTGRFVRAEGHVLTAVAIIARPTEPRPTLRLLSKEPVGEPL